MEIKLKKILTVLIAGTIIFTSTLAIRGEDVLKPQIEEKRPLVVRTVNSSIQGHYLIAENNTVEMYLEDETLSLIIRDKKSQAVLYSTVDEVDPSSNEAWQNFMKSGVVLEYIKGTNVNLYKADMLGEKVVKEITKTSNGFCAAINHTDIGISYEVYVSLTEDGFSVEVPQTSITETNDEFKVGGFYLYPFLGYSKEGEREGYMFIPDGSGALIHLENNYGKFKQPFSKWIYGDNVGIDENAVPSMFKGNDIVKPSEYLLAPVFGMVHTDSKIGVLGIVEGGGEYSAKIEAYPNGALTKYNWITAKFIYRQVYNQPTSKSSGIIAVRQKEMNQFDAKIQYKLVTDEEANYTGLARTYREHLIETGELVPKTYDFKTRIDFLGTEKENWLLFKKSVPMTTVDDVEAIYETLEKEGVNNILSIYKGWQKDGISGGFSVEGVKVDGAIGGRKKLVGLLEKLEETGIELYLDQDVLRMNPQKKSFASHSTMKKVNKRIYEEETYKSVYKTYNYITPKKTAEVMEKNKKVLQKNSMSHLMLSGISNTLFSHSEKGVIKDRIHTASTYEEAIKDYSEAFDLVLEQPFSYLWKYSKAMIDMPLEDSNYIFNSEQIPFLAIVLKGIVPMYTPYINFEANKEENFLRIIEQGMYPSFYVTQEDPSELLYTNSSDIYTSRFDLYKDDIVSYYKELKSLDEQIKGATIITHEKQGYLVKVGYSNGINIYINYGENDEKMDGLMIPAKSYKVGEAL